MRVRVRRGVRGSKKAGRRPHGSGRSRRARGVAAADCLLGSRAVSAGIATALAPRLFRVVWTRRSGRRGGARVQAQETATWLGAPGGGRGATSSRSRAAPLRAGAESSERLPVDFLQDGVCVLDGDRWRWRALRAYPVTGGICRSISFVLLLGAPAALRTDSCGLRRTCRAGYWAKC